MAKMWLVTIVLVSFSSVLFGSLFMTAHGSSHGFICLAEKLTGSAAPCPASDPLGFANFHSGAMKSLSNLILIDGVALLYLIGFLALVSFGFLFANLSSGNLAQSFVISELGLRAASYPIVFKKVSWLALHEKRDPASII